jgi:hypothetical protein
MGSHRGPSADREAGRSPVPVGGLHRRQGRHAPPLGPGRPGR